MTTQRSFKPCRNIASLAILAFLASVLTGCFSSPATKKQKFYQQGEKAFGQQLYPEAIIAYSRALEIDPKFTDAHFRLAQCLEKQSDWPGAVQELQRTIVLQPNHWGAQTDLAQIMLAAGKAQDAKDRANTVLQGDPGNIDAQILVTNADAVLGDTKSALIGAQQAVASGASPLRALLNLAVIQQKAGKDDDAEATLKKAQAADPSSTNPHMALGSLYARHSRWKDAAEQFSSAISVAPHDPAPRVALGALYLKQGDAAAAEKTLTDAKNQAPDNPAMYRLLADYYMARGNYSAALAEFAAISARHQNDVVVKKTYIQLLIMNHRLDEAGQLNDAILKKTPQDTEALVLKGQIQIQQSAFDPAMLTLRQALKLDPDNAMGHYQLGAAIQGKGERQQAEVEWRKAVRLRPDFGQAWSALGNAAAQRSDWRALDSIGAELRKIAPRSPEGYLFQATANFNQGDSAEAEDYLKQFVKIAPQDALGYVKLGELRAHQKRWTEAEDFYRQAMARDSNSIAAVRGIVTLELERGRPAEAVRIAQERVDKNPGDFALTMLLGESQVKAGKPADAERTLERAVSIDGQSIDAVVALAQLQTSQGQATQAIESYRKAAALAPGSAELQSALGQAYEATGDWQAAEACYRRALGLRVDFGPAANNLAYLMLEHGGDLNVALSLAQTARRNMPDVPNTADTLGWAYFRGGSFSSAAPMFEEAVKKDPGNATYHYHLGLAYQKLNDSARAKAELQKAINVNPKSPVAEEARRAEAQADGGS
jgi:tetratricopeptide (TPR) repeat protein